MCGSVCLWVELLEATGIELLPWVYAEGSGDALQPDVWVFRMTASDRRQLMGLMRKVSRTAQTVHELAENWPAQVTTDKTIRTILREMQEDVKTGKTFVRSEREIRRRK